MQNNIALFREKKICIDLKERKKKNTKMLEINLEDKNIRRQ